MAETEGLIIHNGITELITEILPETIEGTVEGEWKTPLIGFVSGDQISDFQFDAENNEGTVEYYFSYDDVNYLPMAQFRQPQAGETSIRFKAVLKRSDLNKTSPMFRKINFTIYRKTIVQEQVCIKLPFVGTICFPVNVEKWSAYPQ